MKEISMFLVKWQSAKKTIKKIIKPFKKITPSYIMLCKGCRDGNVALVEKALVKGADINLMSRIWQGGVSYGAFGTPLVIALTHDTPEKAENYQKIVDMLISHKDFDRENIGFIRTYEDKKYSLDKIILDNFERFFDCGFIDINISGEMFKYLQKYSKQLKMNESEGWYEKFYPNGQKKEVGRIVVDDPRTRRSHNELFVSFYENGHKKKEILKFDGHKIIATYHKNGSLSDTVTIYYGTPVEEDTQVIISEWFDENGSRIKRQKQYQGKERKVLNNQLSKLKSFPPLESRKLLKRELAANYRMRHQKIR